MADIAENTKRAFNDELAETAEVSETADIANMSAIDGDA